PGPARRQGEDRQRFVGHGQEDGGGGGPGPPVPGVGTTAGGGSLRAHAPGPGKSAANTNIVFHGGKLLALWEAGRPWRVDPVTLETIGEDDMGGALGPRRAISAHPKLDRATGEMWNFGVDHGPKNSSSLYRTTADAVTHRGTR